MHPGGLGCDPHGRVECSVTCQINGQNGSAGAAALQQYSESGHWRCKWLQLTACAAVPQLGGGGAKPIGPRASARACFRNSVVAVC